MCWDCLSVCSNDLACCPGIFYERNIWAHNYLHQFFSAVWPSEGLELRIHVNVRFESYFLLGRFYFSEIVNDRKTLSLCKILVSS